MRSRLYLALHCFCRVCGAEDELNRGGRCQTCELTLVIDQLLANPKTGVMAQELVAVSTALKSMKQANSGLT